MKKNYVKPESEFVINLPQEYCAEDVSSVAENSYGADSIVIKDTL